MEGYKTPPFIRFFAKEILELDAKMMCSKKQNRIKCSIAG